jgi:hypothetical protein
MIASGDLQILLTGSRYARFLNCVPSGLQLPAFIATATGLKPAMDLWIAAPRLEAFRGLAAALGLVYAVDAVFDRTDGQLDAIAPDRFTTTRASWRPVASRDGELHIFVSRTAADRDRARASGWYPLVVNGRLLEKHPADHARFGEALGYPPCCVGFFTERNNWLSDNTPYAAAAASAAPGAWQANGLTRHTPAGLVAHLPCSYRCPATIADAERLWTCLRDVSVAYAEAIRELAIGYFLIVSEHQLYRLRDAQVSGEVVRYRAADAVNGASADTRLHRLLQRGDSCRLDGPCVLVERAGRGVGGYLARGDHHGPECPVMLEFS